MPSYQFKIPKEIQHLIDTEASPEEQFLGLAFALMMHLGLNPDGLSGRECSASLLGALMQTAGVGVTTVTDGKGVTLFAMLCDEEQAMRAAQLAHALSQVSGNGAHH